MRVASLDIAGFRNLQESHEIPGFWFVCVWVLGFERGHGVVDVEEQPFEEHQTTHAIGRRRMIVAIVEQFGEYVAWCTAGHEPPPFTVSKKILDAANRHRNKET